MIITILEQIKEGFKDNELRNIISTLECFIPYLLAEEDILLQAAKERLEFIEGILI